MLGIMPGHIYMPAKQAKSGKKVGIMSAARARLAYEAACPAASDLETLASLDFGRHRRRPDQGLNYIELLGMFQNDPETDAIVMIGEIGGSDESDAAAWAKKNVTKPMVAFIAGRTAPPGKRMGHAGAIISGGEDTAEAKTAALKAAGITVAESPATIGEEMAKLLGVKG